MKFESAIKKATKNWEALKSLTPKPEVKGETYYSCPDILETPIGKTHWDNPDLLWLYITSNGEGYKGSQTQLGLTKEGKVVYEYQSHCSCNGYDNTHGIDACPMPDDTTKSYELNEVPKEWKIIVAANIETMLELLKKK